jgi:hypothetical protein
MMEVAYSINEIISQIQASCAYHLVYYSEQIAILLVFIPYSFMFLLPFVTHYAKNLSVDFTKVFALLLEWLSKVISEKKWILVILFALDTKNY